jgi:hypothetical protein
MAHEHTSSRLARWLREGARRELLGAKDRLDLDDLIDDLTQCLLYHDPTVECLELHRLLSSEEEVEIPDPLRRHALEECDLCALRLLQRDEALACELAQLLFVLEPVIDRAVRRIAERSAPT